MKPASGFHSAFLISITLKPSVRREPHKHEKHCLWKSICYPSTATTTAGAILDASNLPLPY